MFPKPQRVKDRAAIKAVTKPYCERCGCRAHGGPHHILTRGSGHGDVPENLIQLCFDCHINKAHGGRIPKEELFQIVARREGIALDECIDRAKASGGNYGYCHNENLGVETGGL